MSDVKRLGVDGSSDVQYHDSRGSFFFDKPNYLARKHGAEPLKLPRMRLVGSTKIDIPVVLRQHQPD